ncbi:MAG: FtsQ-type POTRA domain-containing protein [Myxococcales bacterium]|nr:MAG: FtsQ-type POTRA domain-containing protein [Myxococcales bacterium]
MAGAVQKLNPFSASGSTTAKGKPNRLVVEKGPSAVSIETTRRVIAYVFRFIVFCASLAVLWFAAQWLWSYIKASPSFAVAEVRVEGLHRLKRGEVMQAAHLAFGDNIFDKSLEDLELQIENHPWIAEANIRRRLPDTYLFEIREHEPAALLGLDTLYLVATDGTVFKELAPNDPMDLPVITGVDSKRFKEERDYRASILLGILAMLEEYREAGLLRKETLSEIHVHNDDALTLYIGDDATQVKLGHPPYRAKILRLRKILSKLDEKNVRAAYVLLDYLRRDDRAVVRLRD